MSRRGLAFAAIALACAALAAGYVWRAASRGAQPGGSLPASPVALDGGALTAPALVFRHVSRDGADGELWSAPLADPSAARALAALRCERVHMSAGRGVCLAAKRGVFTTYRALLFDRSFAERGSLPLPGAPSRAQVSPDGRLAAATVFVTGHSYAAGGFSTRTSIIDLETGAWLVEDLESLAVLRDGQPVQAPDFNFWGVTFSPDGRAFYATLGTGDERLLVRGELGARTLEVVAPGVECPSLSPDGTRIAFKARLGGSAASGAWRLSVLDLASGERRTLAEERSVDDQAQWLDGETVTYALRGEGERDGAMDAWAVPADGTGAPRRLLPDAYSAFVARD